MAKMATKKELFLSHENAQKTRKKGLKKRGPFIGNCLIVMGLRRFLMSL